MRVDDQPMDGSTCDRTQVARADAVPWLVRDVMVRRPKTLPGNATVGDARRFFVNPKMVTALLVDAGTFVGVLERDDLPDAASDSVPARDLTRRSVATISPDAGMHDALAELDAKGGYRLVVLADDGETLAGLLCLDRLRSGFCRG